MNIVVDQGTPPEIGEIAVKVINHYGDEVLKVFDLESQRPIDSNPRRSG